jgi:DNA-binding CsgD family transcriptional regulator/PAS domain-containing protein
MDFLLCLLITVSMKTMRKGHPDRCVTPGARPETPEALILALEGEVEAFLVLWARAMDRAGYLRNTTAKREDCILSYLGFMEPIWACVKAGTVAGEFAELLPNPGGFADAVIGMARRHRARGVTSEMFIGCFKTLVQVVEEIIRGFPAPAEAKLSAVDIIRRYADGLETLLTADWSVSTVKDATDRLDEANRRLTLQKNKYENILASTTDLVLVTDAGGLVTEANEAARTFLEETGIIGRPIWRVLGLEASSMAEVVGYYAAGASHELSLYEDTVFLELKVTPLRAVSLASDGYLFLLANITGHVRQREMLEERVQERTAELEQEKRRLEEMNITLRNVLGAIERDREEFLRGLADTVENLLLPTLKRLRGEDSAAARKGYVDLVADRLVRLYAASGADGDARLLLLTPSEMKVCQFVQAGSSSKDIAEALNLSVATVQTHRRNIRRKLKLQNRGLNLFTYLQAKGHEDEAPVD